MKTSKSSGSPSVKQLAELADRLRALPAREYDPWCDGRALSKIEAVAFLKNELLSMRDKGYSVVEIAATLSDAGLRISEAGLYDAMRKLGCSLSRQTVTTAEKLKQHLRHRSSRELKNGDPSEEFGTPGPLDLSRVQGPSGGVTIVEPNARSLIDQLSPEHSLMYHEVLKQLRIGEQVVRLDPPLNDIKDVFLDLGLLTVAERHGQVVYEVPARIASVRGAAGQPIQPKRRVGSRNAR